MGDVENIVHNLKCQAGRTAKVAQALDLGEGATGVEAAAYQAGGNQGAGLGAVDIFQSGRIGPLALGFEVFDLSTDHSVHGAGAAGNLFNDFHACFRRTFEPREHLISLGLERVPSEDGESFPIDYVARWLAAPHIVIVERRQVVVNERIGVQHLQSAA